MTPPTAYPEQDQTAAILAQYGTPLKRAEYAIMQAQSAKRKAREEHARQVMREGRPTDETDVAAVLAIMRAHHDALHTALSVFDAERTSDDFDTRLTCDARYCVYGSRNGSANELPHCPRCHGRAIIGRSFPSGIGETCLCCGHWRYL